MKTSASVHPGLLKLELTLHGVSLAPGLRWQSLIPPGGTTVDLVLPADIVVRVAARPASQPRSRFTLSSEGDRYFICGGDASRCEVRVTPQPQFYDRATSSGLPMRDVARVYGNYIAIHPAASCGFGIRGGPCGGCSGTPSHPSETWFPEVRDVIEVLRAAFDEGSAEFVYLNIPLSADGDQGLPRLEPYVRAIKRHFDTLVAAHFHPPTTNQWIDRTYAMGIDAVGYSIEAFDATALAKYAPGRAQRLGKDRYLHALRHAATVFPNGTVWSDLAVGLESIASTMRAIDELTAMGVVPVLALTTARTEVAASREHALSVTDARALGTHLFTAVKNQGINMGWIRDLSTGITPLEARFFAGDDARLAVAVQNFYRSKVGSIAARNLARLRRRLRVRAVSDSFDASGL